MGQCVRIVLPTYGPWAFIDLAQDDPWDRVAMIPPAYDLQDFPVPRDLTPEDSAGVSSLLGTLTPEVTTRGLPSDGRTPRPPRAGTRTPNALAGRTSRSPSRSARTTDCPPHSVSPASPGGRAPRTGSPVPPGCSSAPPPASSGTGNNSPRAFPTVSPDCDWVSSPAPPVSHS